MTTTDVQIGMPLVVYLERADREGAFEIIDGEEIAQMPTVMGHNDIAKRLYEFLLIWLRTADAGAYLTYEVPFVISQQPNWVTGARIPDLMLVSGVRWQAYITATPDWRQKPLLIPPDLAVEVISPTDAYSAVNRKAETMLRDGVRLVWLIDPFTRLATALTATTTHRIDEAGVLDGGEVLPGFSVSLTEVLA